MNRIFASAVAVCAVLILGDAEPAAQSRALVRIASIVPARSLWDNTLQQMRSDWQKNTGGRVTGRIHAGAVMGDEPTTLLKLKSGGIEGALLTLPGLARVDAAFNAFGIPLFYESYDELNHVMRQLTPVIEQRLASRGFVLLHWAHGGWVRVFSTRPVTTLDDLKRLKMFTSAGDDEMIAIYQARGFRPIGLSATAILTGLTSGLIEALPTTPTAALLSQWYDRAKYMVDVPLAPLIGATIVTDRAWRSIGEADRGAVLTAAKTAESRLSKEVPKQDDEAVREMVRQGLVVTKAAGPAWQAEASRFADAMKGMVPDDVYNAAVRERNAYRERRR
jgi:TRAP-type C4-dicarboxylate transport system substrate-binding protein